MNKSIMRIANKLTYNDMLKAGDVSIENATFVSQCHEVSVISINEDRINKLIKFYFRF